MKILKGEKNTKKTKTMIIVASIIAAVLIILLIFAFATRWTRYVKYSQEPWHLTENMKIDKVMKLAMKNVSYQQKNHRVIVKGIDKNTDNKMTFIFYISKDKEKTIKLGTAKRGDTELSHAQFIYYLKQYVIEDSTK